MIRRRGWWSLTSDVAYSPLYASRGLVDLADAAIRTEHRAEAQRIVGRLEQMAATNRSPFIEVTLGCVRPMLADDDNAEALYRMAVGDLPPKMTFLRARVQLSCGAWLRRRGRVADSRIPLRAARQAFDALGAVPWAARPRQELRASGETSRRRSPDRRDDLTRQEQQIALMAAKGLTNREIGERLFLSHRTVGSHLYRLFPKLGISSRSQLTEAIVAGEQ